MEERLVKVGITHGDINGIGYEVILKTFSDTRMAELCTPIIYGSSKIAAYHRKALELPPINMNIISWMADTYFANHMSILKTFLGSVVTAYPWAYAVVLFFTSKLVNSQGAAVAIVMPMALNLGMDPIMVLSFIPACYGYFFLPTYPSDLACIGFDRSGTTRIGKFVLNHSFMLPGLTGVVTACIAGFIIAHVLY